MAAGVEGPSRAAGDAGRDLQTWSHVGRLYDLHRSEDGLLWLGTSQGAQRFDGVNFVRVALPPELDAASSVRIVLPTRGGDLWVATGSGYVDVAKRADGVYVRRPWGQLALARRHEGNWRIWRRADGLPSDTVLALYEDGAGGIWVGTDVGAVRLQNDRFVPVVLQASAAADPKDAGPVLAIAERDGSVAVATDKGIWTGPAGGPLVMTYAVGPAVAMAWGPEGVLWAGTPDGLFKLRPGAPAQPVGNLTFAFSLHLSRDGSLLVASDSGVHRIDARTLKMELAAEVPFARRAVEDREGSLWIASRARGLVAHRPLRARSLATPEFSTAFAVLPTRAGPVWVSSTAGLQRWDGDRSTTLSYGQRLQSWAVRSMAEAPDGTVWVAADPQGLLRLNGLAVEYVATPTVRGIFVDRSGALWVAWPRGGVSRFVGGHPGGVGQSFTEADGLCRGPLWTHSTGANGRMWFAGEGGVSLVEEGRASCIAVAQGLPALPAYAVHEDSAGGVWIGTGATTGLVRWKNNTVHQVPVAQHGGTGPVYGIVEDRQAALWLSSGHGVTRMLRRDLEDLIDGKPLGGSPIVYDVEEGMTVAECTATFSPSVAVDVRGDVWAPTIAGPVMITPPERWPVRQTSAVIDGLEVGGRAIDWRIPPAIDVASGSSLDLHVGAPTSVAPRKVSFKHRLEGVDADWKATGPDRRARYAALPAGQLMFTVRAVDEWGRPLGQEATLLVRSRRPWGRAALTTLAAVVLAAAMAYAAHLWRVRRIEAQHRLVDDERRRIARDLHDGLAQGFVAIRLQLTVARSSMAQIPAAVAAALASAGDALDWAQAQLRTAVWSLRNPDPRGVSSAALVTRVVDEFRRQTGLQVRCVTSDASPPLSGELEHEIGQIVREALTNAARHAGARRVSVTVSLTHDEAGLRILISDNGRGFDVGAPAGGGAGLLGIRERAARMGAAVEIQSQPGEGTQLILTVPLAAMAVQQEQG